MVRRVPSFQAFGKYEVFRHDWKREVRRGPRVSIPHWIKAAKILSGPGLLKGDILKKAVLTS